MKEQNYMAKNLRSYKELRKLTMKEFADELGIPLSTLRTVLKEGNTTLHTAIQISRRLGISLDMLTSDHDFPDKLFFMDQMQRTASWFSSLPADKKDVFAKLVTDMWNMVIDSELNRENEND